MHIPYSKWYFEESVWQGKNLNNNFQPKKYQVQNLGFKFLKYRGPCKREVRKGQHQQTQSLSSTKELNYSSSGCTTLQNALRPFPSMTVVLITLQFTAGVDDPEKKRSFPLFIK